MIRIISGTLIILAILLLVVLGIGYISPLEYRTQETRPFSSSESELWSVLTYTVNYAEQKREVVGLEILERNQGVITKWKENIKAGGYRIYKLIERRTPNKLVLEITDSRETLTGTWLYELRENDDKTYLTITEESQQTNVFWRGLRTIMGRDSFVDHEFKWIQVSLFNKILYE